MPCKGLNKSFGSNPGLFRGEKDLVELAQLNDIKGLFLDNTTLLPTASISSSGVLVSTVNALIKVIG
jgi:hypothetical protein